MNNTFYGLSCNPFDKQALTLGAQVQKQVIDFEIILAAVNEQTLG